VYECRREEYEGPGRKERTRWEPVQANSEAYLPSVQKLLLPPTAQALVPREIHLI